jgi:hypothetical protein
LKEMKWNEFQDSKLSDIRVVSTKMS